MICQLNNYDFDDYGLISIMYHRFNENKYTSTNIQIDVMRAVLEIARPGLVEGQEENQCIPGDINGDAVLNVLDVVLTVNMALNLDDQNDCADINSDDIINILDIVLLINLILY